MEQIKQYLEVKYIVPAVLLLIGLFVAYKYFFSAPAAPVPVVDEQFTDAVPQPQMEDDEDEEQFIEPPHEPDVEAFDGAFYSSFESLD